MLYKKTGFPEVEDIVTCTVTNVQPHSVFVRLNEYPMVGMIHISEISPGRIRNIRDFVSEGRVVVCKVLRVNQEKSQIDLSLRRVSEGLRRKKIEEMRQEVKAEKIIENFSKGIKKTAAEIYPKVAEPLLSEFEYIYQAFEKIVEENTSLADFGVEPEISKDLTIFVKERIQPKEIKLMGELSLQSYDPKGVDVVKKIISLGMEKQENAEITYLGGGKFKVIVKTKDPKQAEKMLDAVSSAILDAAKENHAEASFKRLE